MNKRHGVSYQKRVKEINKIYDNYASRGIPNREIWRRYIYPIYGISERTFYNVLKAPSLARNNIADAPHQLFLFDIKELFGDEK